MRGLGFKAVSGRELNVLSSGINLEKNPYV